MKDDDFGKKELKREKRRYGFLPRKSADENRKNVNVRCKMKLIA